jgi:hypothetical protein
MGYVAHDTDLYIVGKGILWFDRFDSNGLPTGLRDVGNAPGLMLTPSVTDLKHYSSRGGIKKVDKVVNIEIGMGVKFTLDEWDIKNLALAVLGTLSDDETELYILGENQIRGELRLFGNPATGPKYNLYLWDVLLKSNTDLGFIQDAEWGEIEFEGDLQEDLDNHPDNPYGIIQIVTQGS